MLRTLSSRSEQGNAVHTVECNNEAVFKIIPKEAQKTMRDAVIMGGKRAAIYVADLSQHDTELDIRFATLSNSIVSGEHWTAHRLVCVPRCPEQKTDEWDMIEDFYKIMYQQAQWSGVTSEVFTDYLKGENLI